MKIARMRPQVTTFQMQMKPLGCLKGISKADIALVRTEEEAIVERFLGVYSWGQDLRAVLDPTSSKCTLSELDGIAKISNELYSKHLMLSHRCLHLCAPFLTSEKGIFLLSMRN